MDTPSGCFCPSSLADLYLLWLEFHSRERGTGILVGADEIKKTLRNLMDKRNPVKTNVMEMKEKNRKAVVHGGSSFDSIGCFIVDILSQKLPLVKK
ncbi:hypothetical protein Leryth_015893 [Lithospermum erythrorhizon]|nr:hypothetical protein Leryth_015893 [Lithospermum erythrorhizon]